MVNFFIMAEKLTCRRLPFFYSGVDSAYTNRRTGALPRQKEQQIKDIISTVRILLFKPKGSTKTKHRSKVTMNVLELRDIFYSAANREILAGLTLGIEAGEVHALLGTNGTGKSTLANMIMGCHGYQPLSGGILFNGAPINDLKIHERARLGICMAWQEPARFEGLRVQQYLTLGTATEAPEASLRLVGLEPSRYLGRMVDRSLSGGERKRIELASVTALRPKLAILDEPDSGIDMLSTDDIIRVLERLRSGGSAVLLITHRDEIAAAANRASQICGGRIVCTGTPADVAAVFKSRKCIYCDGEVCGDD